MNMLDKFRILIKNAKLTKNLTHLEELSDTISGLIEYFTQFRKSNKSVETLDLKYEIAELNDLNNTIIRIQAYMTSPLKPIDKTQIYRNPELRLYGGKR